MALQIWLAHLIKVLEEDGLPKSVRRLATALASHAERRVRLTVGSSCWVFRQSRRSPAEEVWCRSQVG